MYTYHVKIMNATQMILWFIDFCIGQFTKLTKRPNLLRDKMDERHLYAGRGDKMQGIFWLKFFGLSVLYYFVRLYLKVYECKIITYHTYVTMALTHIFQGKKCQSCFKKREILEHLNKSWMAWMLWVILHHFFGSHVKRFVVFLENFFSSILLTCFYLGLLHYEKMDENVKMDTYNVLDFRVVFQKKVF